MKQMQKHRCRVVLICLMAMLMTLFAGFVSLAEENTPTRVINVVYDDSGSMVETGGQKANVAKVHEMLTKPEGLEKELSALSYDFDGDAEKDALYIIEDSELDLGLLDSVIRNLPRMLEILEDFLSWHFESWMDLRSMRKTVLPLRRGDGQRTLKAGVRKRFPHGMRLWKKSADEGEKTRRIQRRQL